jgi:hypothetical protein
VIISAVLLNQGELAGAKGLALSCLDRPGSLVRLFHRRATLVVAMGLCVGREHRAVNALHKMGQFDICADVLPSGFHTRGRLAFCARAASNLFVNSDLRWLFRPCKRASGEPLDSESSVSLTTGSGSSLRNPI